MTMGPAGPLKQRMRLAVSWFLTGSLLAQGLRLLSSLLLTRLLMPEAFGLMAAIPLLLIHALLQTKTNALVDSLEMASVKFLNAVTERQLKAGA